MSSARFISLLALVAMASLAGCSKSSSSSAPPPPPPAVAAPVAQAEPAHVHSAPAPADAAAEHVHSAPAGAAEKEWLQPPAITDADIPPMPVVPFAAARPMEIVRAVYVFAAKHPEVLSHMPCFCGCETRGHKHNADCFVAARDSQGKPTAWEPHGVGCAICLDVAHEAMQMHASGASIADIRATIERKYRSSFPSMTPTPPVTGGQ